MRPRLRIGNASPAIGNPNSTRYRQVIASRSSGTYQKGIRQGCKCYTAHCAVTSYDAGAHARLGWSKSAFRAAGPAFGQGRGPLRLAAGWLVRTCPWRRCPAHPLPKSCRRDAMRKKTRRPIGRTKDTPPSPQMGKGRRLMPCNGAGGDPRDPAPDRAARRARNDVLLYFPALVSRASMSARRSLTYSGL